jgi:hypothetical protein
MSYRTIEKVLASAAAEPISDVSLPVTSALIQIKRSNSHALEISIGSFVTGMGHELPKPTADAQLPELLLSTQQGVQGIDLKDWYVMGTQGEGINILVEEF